LTYVAHIGHVLLGQFNGELVQALKVVRRISDIRWSESKPFDNLQDGDKVSLLFSLGIRIVVTKVAVSIVSFGESKVDVDSFGVTNVQESIGLGRESCDVFTAGGLEVLRHQFRFDLGILAGLVQPSEFSFKEHVGHIEDRRCFLYCDFLLDLGFAIFFLQIGR